jgi:hypothetical protein
MAALVLASTLVTGPPAVRAEETPDAQLLLDLDLLSQADPHERDLLRRLSLVERLRLLELYQLIEARPAMPARRPPPAPSDPAPGAERGR